ncbi:MAG: 3-phosphoshikimate 1-carboxyvinyltransferase [Nitrospirota bacterium]
MKSKSLFGTMMDIPGDKSITHRAIIMASLAEGESNIIGPLLSEDCQQTRLAFEQMGVSINQYPDATTSLRIQGRGIASLVEPSDVIDCGNSGTTMRLLTGLLSGQHFFSVLKGDTSLHKRPMRRVVDPLREMGAEIDGRSGGAFAPLAIKGKQLSGIKYTLPVASAQVKSALLLAGLSAKGETVITDPFGTRDHTEQMFRSFGVAFKQEGNCSTTLGGQSFYGKTIRVPSDFSSAAFFIVAALILPGSRIVIRNVGINSTRTGLLDILKKQMNANITVTEKEQGDFCEPVADITVESSQLIGCVVEEDQIPRMIDEFPILCVAAAAADGETTIRGAKELRVKESDRIITMSNALRNIAGVLIEEFPDGIKIRGIEEWKRLGEGLCVTNADHRVAMAMRIASLRTVGGIQLDNKDCINTSFPSFDRILGELCR